MNLGAPEIGLIVLAVFLLFGYKKLPDASRSLGRSLRIFKGEMGGMKDDDARAAAAPAVPDLEREAAEAEAAALEARARAARARADAQHPQLPA
ncbi:Sec-independent protein translocase subunit TatA [Klenkia terrae]|jgi:sec-independent protein translocase protein TatA|uniref:Sec-independent protein translocase protein TatA n=1 Tax=Klenkia terrae TaxID=1052259 RepID=A0ABU8EAZ1_9ACTN|nr:Sec-independent protein translocase subunit TatA [Klenkia terrae]SSC23333.1 Sec-independent protein translocase protein TatA/E [Klenkia terrae]